MNEAFDKLARKARDAATTTAAAARQAAGAAGTTAQKVREAGASAAVRLGDLNGDGIVDAKDVAIALDRGRDTATQAAGVAKDALKQSPLAKKMAIGGAIGAGIALPLPFVGSFMGAVIGAGVAALKYKAANEAGNGAGAAGTGKDFDLHTEVTKLADLLDRGLITEEQFESERDRLFKAKRRF